MPADRLAEHARARHEKTLKQAHETLAELAESAESIAVARLSSRAGVSRSWIYTQPELLEQIHQLRNHQTAKSADMAGTRASDESLRQRLALAHERITQLRTENQQLRASLALAHRQLRAARQTDIQEQ